MHSCLRSPPPPPTPHDVWPVKPPVFRPSGQASQLEAVVARRVVFENVFTGHSSAMPLLGDNQPGNTQPANATQKTCHHGVAWFQSFRPPQSCVVVQAWGHLPHAVLPVVPFVDVPLAQGRHVEPPAAAYVSTGQGSGVVMEPASQLAISSTVRAIALIAVTRAESYSHTPPKQVVPEAVKRPPRHSHEVWPVRVPVLLPAGQASQLAAAEARRMVFEDVFTGHIAGARVAESYQ